MNPFDNSIVLIDEAHNLTRGCRTAGASRWARPRRDAGAAGCLQVFASPLPYAPEKPSSHLSKVAQRRRVLSTLIDEEEKMEYFTF